MKLRFWLKNNLADI